MRLSLLSLFFLTAFVATLLWGVIQSRYIANIKSHSSIHIPLVGKDQVAYTSISDNGAIIVVGEKTKARIKLDCLSGSATETLFEEPLGPGKHTLWLSPVTKPGTEEAFGLSVHGRSHTINYAWSDGRSGTYDIIMSGTDTKELIEALDIEHEVRAISYRVILEVLGEPKPVDDSIPLPP